MSKPTRNDALKDRLSRSHEINISVTGRKSGRTISIPVWFVLEDEKLYLLPRRCRPRPGALTVRPHRSPASVFAMNLRLTDSR